MAASAPVTALVDHLIDLFNRRSLDLPEGFITRRTQFLLNGVPFEAMLGRAPTDPLVLMLTRGPAGYRVTAQALQHAIPDAQFQRGEFDEAVIDGVRHVTGTCWLSGHYRGTSTAAEILIEMDLTLHGEGVEHAAATLDPQALALVQQARLRP